MRTFVRGLLVCLAALAACWVVADLLVWKGPLHARLQRGRGDAVAAEVEGVPVTRLELREALRKHLWVRSESWETMSREARRHTRQAVLESLINDRLIRFWRLREAGDAPAGPEVRRESALMRRQFIDATEHDRRLAGQQHTQKTLDEAIRNAQLDEAWIAAKTGADPRDEARAWYSRHKETLRIPQAHHAAHIFLSRHDATKPDREAEIRRIHRSWISKEKSFAALAREHSEDDRTKTLGGDLGWFTRQRMPADFVSAVEKLRVGEPGEPVSTALGWHLILVLERRPSRLPTFDECRHEVAASLAATRREHALKALINDLRQRSSSRISFHKTVIDLAEPAP